MSMTMWHMMCLTGLNLAQLNRHATEIARKDAAGKTYTNTELS